MAEVKTGKDGNPFYWIPSDGHTWEEKNLCREESNLFRKTMEINPDNLIGQTYDFYGAHSNCFKIGPMVFECLEDPSDGYRSHWDMLLIHPDQQMTGFFTTPIARVRLREFFDGEVSDAGKGAAGGYSSNYDMVEGWKLVDVEDGHVWVEFGTKNYDDYYPMFWFYYQVKVSEDETP